MKSSLKQTILAAHDGRPEEIDVPEWSCKLHIRVMTGTERNEYERTVFENGRAKTEDLFSHLLVRTICEPDGSRVFNDDEAKALSGKSFTVLKYLHDRAARKNGLLKEEVDSLAKNSSSAPAAGSTTN
jgi:hypothetical protein